MDGVPCVKVRMDGGPLRMARVTAEHPGSAIDLVACRRKDGVRVAFVVHGLPGAAIDGLEAELADVYDPLRTWHQDGTWHGEGIIAREAIEHPLLRVGAAALELTDAPWLHYEQGMITAILLPRSDMDLMVLQGQTRRLIDGLGVDAEVRLGHTSLARYRTWRELCPADLLE